MLSLCRLSILIYLEVAASSVYIGSKSKGGYMYQMPFVISKEYFPDTSTMLMKTATIVYAGWMAGGVVKPLRPTLRRGTCWEVASNGVPKSLHSALS